MLKITQLPVLNDNYIYLIHDELSGETAVIDPAQSEPVLNYLKQQNWQLTYILNTHHHHDHVGGNVELKKATQCKIAGSKSDNARIPEIDRLLTENDSLTLGDYTIEIIECSGHTLGHIAFYIPDANALFCGDTLFSMGCGRLFEGTAEQMYHSLQKFKALPADTKIYCAHEYSVANARFALSVEAHNIDLQNHYTKIQALRLANKSTVPTTLAQELKINPFLRCDSLEIHQHLNLKNRSDLEVFTVLRELKNNF